MPIDPRTIRSHTFAPEGPTADTVKLTARAAEQTGQPQALHHHQHGVPCWPANHDRGACLVIHPDGQAEQLVPAVPSAPVQLHAPVLADEAAALGLTRPGLPGEPWHVEPVRELDPAGAAEVGRGVRDAQAQQALRDQYPDAPTIVKVVTGDPEDQPHAYGLAQDLDPTNWPEAGDVLDPGGYSADPPSHHAELAEDPEGNGAAGQFPSAGVNGGPS